MRSYSTYTKVLTILLIGFAITTVHSSPGEMRSLMLPHHLLGSIKQNASPWILDVRTPKEYDDGHIATAHLIPVSELNQKLDLLPRNKSELILVYCRSGRRAQSAIHVLKSNGYTNVVELEGHFTRWQEKGFPYETSSSTNKASVAPAPNK